MNIVKYQPWETLNHLSQELDRWLGSNLSSSGWGSGTATAENIVDWSPAVDIKENDKEFVLRVDVPGVNPDDIEITMSDGTLTVSGHRETESQKDEQGYHRVERFSGRFCRRFYLPEAVDGDQIKARSDQGVLELTIPKQAKAQPKKIKVQH